MIFEHPVCIGYIIIIFCVGTTDGRDELAGGRRGRRRRRPPPWPSSWSQGRHLHHIMQPFVLLQLFFFILIFFLNLVRREVNSTEYFVGPLSVRVSVSYLSAQLSYRGAIIVLALFSASRVSTSISYFVRPVIQAKQLARWATIAPRWNSEKIVGQKIYYNYITIFCFYFILRYSMVIL